MPRNDRHICFTVGFQFKPKFDEKVMYYMRIAEEYGTNKAKLLLNPNKKVIPYNRKHPCTCEKCIKIPEKDREYHHWQCYVEWKPNFRPKSYIEMWPWLGLYARCSIRQGPKDKAIDYCGLGEEIPPEDFGAPEVQGRRIALDNIKEKVEKGEIKNMRDALLILPPENCAGNRNYIKDCIENLTEAPERENYHIEIYWGGAGNGKNEWLKKLYPKKIAYWKDVESKYWFQYRGEKTIVMTEVNDIDLRIKDIIKWCDSAPFRVPTFYGMQPLLANKFILISNFDPQNWWPTAAQNQKDAFWRRVTENFDCRARFTIKNCKPKPAKILYIEEDPLLIN